MVCSRWSRIFVKNFTIFEFSGPRAAGPPANTSYRSAGMVCSRWSRIFVKNFTIFEFSGPRAAGPQANTSYRSAGMVCSRWSRNFVKNFTIFGVSGPGRSEKPLQRVARDAVFRVDKAKYHERGGVWGFDSSGGNFHDRCRSLQAMPQTDQGE
jgi:hypothetical protein